jgi:LPXTG-motif cell wall-anchored protein
MGSHGSNRRRGPTVRRLGVTTIGFGAIVIGGLAGSAAAHNPQIVASCNGLSVQFRGYQGRATNNQVTITIDGVTSQYSFGVQSTRTFPWNPVGDHDYSIVLDANRQLGDAVAFDRSFAGTQHACPPAIPATAPAMVTAPPTTTPAAPPADGTPTPTTSPISIAPASATPPTEPVPSATVPVEVVAPVTVAPTETAPAAATQADTTPTAAVPAETVPGATPLLPATPVPPTTDPGVTVAPDAEQPSRVLTPEQGGSSTGTGTAADTPAAATDVTVASGTPTTTQPAVTSADDATDSDLGAADSGSDTADDDTVGRGNDRAVVDVGAPRDTRNAVALDLPAASTLPSTGSNTLPQVAAGGAVVLLGLGLIRLGRRPAATADQPGPA